MKFQCLSALVLALCLGVLPAAASTVLFDNSASDGLLGSLPVDNGNWASDSFTLDGPGIATSINLGLWENVFQRAAQLDWSIGLKPDGDTVDSGTATVTNQSISSIGPIELDLVSFGLGSGVALSAGTTYYLTIEGAEQSNGRVAPVSWARNGNPDIDVVFDGVHLPSFEASSFQVLGTATPEPASFALIGSGLLLTGLLLRRKATRH